MPSDDEAPAAPTGARPSLEAVTEALAAPDEDSTTERLIPEGNRSRPKQLWLVLASLVPLFLLMACDRHFGFSVPLGSAALLVASFGLLDAFGTFDDAPSDPVSPAPPSLRSLTPRLVEFGAAVVSVVAALRVAVAGLLPHPVLCAAVLVTGTLVWLVISLCRLAEALRIFQLGEARWFARHGFWLVLLNILLYVPLLGSYALSDPWEAHYGEVSREMLARDDWISLWWAQDGWFWSKPVLDFWLQGLGFSLTGVHFMPDQMLASASLGLSPAPEWPARLPIVLFTILATYFLYKAVAKVFGGRAGFLAALVLTTAPYWYLIAHQSMTDMPYVAPLTAALALVVLGMRTDPEARVRTVELSVRGRVLRLSAFHLLFGGILLSVLPQLVYLLTRNVTLQLTAPNFGFRWHLDEFFSGSG
ncbi:MAG TPA: glycosyltransferase family 39 protein, partial [Polyangiaceae bacterium]